MDPSPSASLVASPPFQDLLALVEEQPNNIMVETQESVVGGNGCGDVLTEEEVGFSFVEFNIAYYVEDEAIRQWIIT